MQDKLKSKMQRNFSPKQQWSREVRKFNDRLHRYEQKGVKFKVQPIDEESKIEYTPEAIEKVQQMNRDMFKGATLHIGGYSNITGEREIKSALRNQEKVTQQRRTSATASLSHKSVSPRLNNNIASETDEVITRAREMVDKIVDDKPTKEHDGRGGTRTSTKEHAGERTPRGKDKTKRKERSDKGVQRGSRLVSSLTTKLQQLYDMVADYNPESIPNIPPSLYPERHAMQLTVAQHIMVLMGALDQDEETKKEYARSILSNEANIIYLWERVMYDSNSTFHEPDFYQLLSLLGLGIIGDIIDVEEYEELIEDNEPW